MSHRNNSEEISPFARVFSKEIEKDFKQARDEVSLQRKYLSYVGKIDRWFSCNAYSREFLQGVLRFEKNERKKKIVEGRSRG